MPPQPRYPYLLSLAVCVESRHAAAKIRECRRRRSDSGQTGRGVRGFLAAAEQRRLADWETAGRRVRRRRDGLAGMHMR